MIEDELFFVGQKAFIDKGSEILTLNDADLGIDFPGGKIQIGEEDFSESLRREVKEETGLEIEVGLPFITWLHVMRRGENIGKKIFLVGYKCKYVSGEVKISDEHNGFKWLSGENYRSADGNQEYFRYLKAYFEGS